MARQYVKVVGVGGGRMSARKPRVPKLVAHGGRVSNARRKA